MEDTQGIVPQGDDDRLFPPAKAATGDLPVISRYGRSDWAGDVTLVPKVAQSWRNHLANVEQVPTLLTRPFTHDEAHSVAAWAYPPPFDLYDVDPTNTSLFTNRDPDGSGYYPAAEDDGMVVAFCVFGPEARVRGQQPQDGVLDVGLGVRPDLTSRGLASGLFEQVAALAWDVFHPHQLRTAVATFNDRSLALCRKAGFIPVRDFTGPGDRRFRELTCALEPQ